MKKFFLVILKSLTVLICLIIIYLNLSMYYSPKFATIDGQFYNKDVYQQLHFLKERLNNGAGEKMQAIYPEGFIFLNVLYGLAWVDLVRELNTDNIIYKEGVKEIEWALKELYKDETKTIFPKYLPLEYGAFYQSWTTYLLAKKLEIQPSNEQLPSDIILFQEKCNLIAGAIDSSQTPFLESYVYHSWAADIMVGMAAISTYDKLFDRKYEPLTERWLEKVKANLDPHTGLIPHQSDSETGQSLTGARGSSQSLMLIFLKEIDEEFANAQFEIYKKEFLTKRLGLPGIREYQSGNVSNGDIDSGPVIWGIGGSASLTGQRTMALYEDWRTYIGLRNSIIGFGASHTIKGKKRLLFGALPMADAFVAWAGSAERKPIKGIIGWRWIFQLISFCVLLLSWLFFRRHHLLIIMPQKGLFGM